MTTMALAGLKGGGGSCTIGSDASFSIQSAASLPAVIQDQVPVPQDVSSSGWKLFTQQESLLEPSELIKFGTSQDEEFNINRPAPFENEDALLVEPLGTRCQLCKIDVAYRPQGDAGRDANAPPFVVVLACHHAFHSCCIESVYGVDEPA